MSLSDSLKSLTRQLSKEFANFRDTFALFGLYYTSKITLNIVSNVLYGFKTYVISSIISNDKWLKSQGGWAVVTGSTHGIGLAYAAELAKREINLILVARNKDYLDKVAKSFQEKYNIQVITVVVDLAEFAKFDFIEKVISDKDIGILVNNAAFPGEVGFFNDNSTDAINRVIDVNVKAVVHITRMVLPQMIKKNKGILVNVSSVITYLHPAYGSMYAASKSFMNSFTEALQYEYKDTNLFIQCLLPGLVETKMSVGHLGARAKSVGVDVTKYASGAVRTLGYSNNTCGNWFHGLNYAIRSLFPKSYANERMYLSLIRKQMQNRTTNSIESCQHDDLDKILNSK